MTGFRLARGGYQERCGITPDLTALGKVIGGGLPVGAFGGRAEIMDCLSPDGPVYQAGTLSGNPLAMAAGLAQLRELERLDGWAQLEELGAAFEEATRAALRQAGKDYTFQRIGSMFCLYFATGAVWNLADAQRSRPRGLQRVLPSLPRARRLFRALAIRGRLPLPRAHRRGSGEDRRSRRGLALTGLSRSTN